MVKINPMIDLSVKKSQREGENGERDIRKIKKLVSKYGKQGVQKPRVCKIFWKREIKKEK